MRCQDNKQCNTIVCREGVTVVQIGCHSHPVNLLLEKDKAFIQYILKIVHYVQYYLFREFIKRFILYIV